MPVREEQFESHSVHTALSQLDSALQEKSAKELSDGAIDNLDRIRQATAFIRSRMDVASPLLTPSNRLDQIQKSLQGCLNEINQFNSNGNEGHLSNASNHIDAGLNNAAALISLEQPEPTVKAKDAVSFKTLAEEVITSLRDKAQSVEDRAVKIESTLHALEKRSEDQNTQINSIQSTLDSKLQELENQFAAAQTERTSEFEAQAEKIKKEADERLSSISQSADETLSEISDKKTEAERIVNLIGNIGLTGNFKGAVAREKQSADQYETDCSKLLYRDGRRRSGDVIPFYLEWFRSMACVISPRRGSQFDCSSRLRGAGVIPASDTGEQESPRGTGAR